MRGLWGLLYIVLSVPIWITGILALHKIDQMAAESLAVLTVLALAFSMSWGKDG
jgi:hypothetical protein